MMFSTVKGLIGKVCPSFMLKPAMTITRKGRAIRAAIAMKLSPQKMEWFCPCCNKRFSGFVKADYIDSKNYELRRYESTRQDVLCPVCHALPRHRILASWCDSHKDLFQNAAILYFAPEYSMTQWMKRNGVKYTSVDLYREADLKLDIQNTGLPEQSYDIIIANHVLEHVDDFRRALDEMNRILRSGGSFICSFPMDPKIELLDEDPIVITPEERMRRFGQNDHKRVFGMKADQFLNEAGFMVEKIDGKDYPEEILPIVGPADYDMNILFCCRKQYAGH